MIKFSIRSNKYYRTYQKKLEKKMKHVLIKVHRINKERANTKDWTKK